MYFSYPIKFQKLAIFYFFFEFRFLPSKSSNEQEMGSSSAICVACLESCSARSASKESSFYLMYGRDPRTPLDIAWNTEDHTPVATMDQYKVDLMRRLRCLLHYQNMQQAAQEPHKQTV